MSSRAVLVTGGAGLLAREVTRVLTSDGARVETLGRDRLDICDEGAVRRVILGMRPDAVIHCAAMTNVDGCETNREDAWAVNASGAGNVARAAHEVGAEIVAVSTDYVFDGTKGEPYLESDEPNPIQEYGRSKLAGELEVRRATPRHYIVRSAWIYGMGGKNFPSRVFDIARTQPALKAVNDQTGSPTYAPDLARAISRLLGTGSHGLYHVTNDGTCTFAELIRSALHAGALEPEIEEVSSRDLGLAAPRPTYTGLANANWRGLGWEPLRHWRDAVRAFAAQAAGS